MTDRHALIERYRPREDFVPAAVWAEIGDLVRHATRVFDPQAASTTEVVLSTVAGYVRWAHDQGHELTTDAVFHPDNVEYFLATEGASWARSTRSQRASVLRSLGPKVATRAPWGPAPYRTKYTPVQPPYSPREVDAFWQCARTQHTPLRQRRFKTVLALGLGAGLRAGEMTLASGSDVVETGDVVSVTVRGDNARVVPVVARWGPVLLDLAETAQDRPLGGQPLDSLHDSRLFLDPVRVPEGLPKLVLARLRATWLTAVMATGLNIAEIMHLAGLRSTRSLEALLPLLPIDPDRVTRCAVAATYLPGRT